MRTVHTQVGIVGAGPAGLLLSHLLHLRGIESVVLEVRDRQYVEERVRAGVLEHGTVDLLCSTGVGDRLRREGMEHSGIELAFEEQRHRIDLRTLTGKCITVYGQQEVVKDLIAARLAAGGAVLFEVNGITLHGIESSKPFIRGHQQNEDIEVHCDFIAGCDGYHGVSRPSIPPGVLQVFERDYPFAWLGILAEAAPSARELIYSFHTRGLALFSMRSPRVTRLYLQCAVDEDLDEWPDERIWDELQFRLRMRDGWMPNRGPILQKSVTGMRSFVTAPMQFGRLFLAGDAAHIVPPAGAKGLNLAAADVRVLAHALNEFYVSGGTRSLDDYSETCLARVWKVQRFSWWMTSLLHRYDQEQGFEYHRQLAELSYLTSSRAAMTSLAENYVGLPFGPLD